jgi:flagellar biosynthetic protein FliP
MSMSRALPGRRPSGAGHRRFLRHVVEMSVSMIVGMIAAAAVFLTPLGLTADEALVRYPIRFILVIAVGMTVTMVAWMRFRGHDWRSCGEMTLAMALPLIPIVLLRVTDVISAEACGVYCVASFAAMIGLMVVRRSDYGFDAVNVEAETLF